MTILIEELLHIGNESIQVCNYIELNITAMRKILKKFDKKFKDMRKAVKESYLKSRLDMSNSHLSALLSFHVKNLIKNNSVRLLTKSA